MTPQQFLSQHADLPPAQRLEALVSLLRGPQGCPWDQRQTAASIIDFVIDEAHELKQALTEKNTAEVVDELGDLAFTFEFLRQTLHHQAPQDQAVTRVVEKMILRHPHVFEPGDPLAEKEIKRRWESLKLAQGPASRRLDRDLPASLPAWKKAAKVLTRARNVGFRYPERQAAWDKVAEEWMELQAALEIESRERQESELGDLLLALQSAAMESDLDGEKALLASARKLADRLERVEQQAGRGLSEIPYSELAEHYARAHQEDPWQGGAYFNYCGVSPWPAQVQRAVARAARLVGRGGLPGALQLIGERQTLRQKLARLVGHEPERVVLLPNVSQAALGVGYCLDWEPGQSILLGRQEFPANTVPWRLAAQTFGLRVLDFDDDLVRRDPESGWAQLSQLLEKERPRLLAISLVSYWSGYRWDTERLAGLCQQSGTMLYLDGIQALGSVPVRMHEGVDFLAGGSHKTMLAPEGAGFMFTSARAARHWVPRLAGWLSLPDPVDFLVEGRPELDPNQKSPRPGDPGTLEGSSLNALGYAGLSAALDYLESHGVDQIFRHVQGLHDLLEPRLQELGFSSNRSAQSKERSAILSFDPPPGVSLVRLQAELGERGVVVAIPRGRLRFGLHLANNPTEVRRLVQLLPQLLELARA
jgi:MazG family protein